jgi:hypothetical protein
MTRLEFRLKKLEEKSDARDQTTIREIVIDGKPSFEIERRMHGRVYVKRYVGVRLDAI